MLEFADTDTTPGSTNGQPEHDRRVVAILPRGEAIRNFIYTGALDEVARDSEVTLLSVIPSEEIRGLLQDRYKAVYELEDLPENRLVVALREILDMAHGRWLWSEAARRRWRLRDVEAVARKRRLKRLAKKIACYSFASPSGLEVLSAIERYSSKWLRPTDKYVELLTEIRPSLVFNGSHVHSRVGMQAVRAAQWLGIPTATFIFSWDNLTSQGRIIPPYDYYLVWNDAIRDQLLRIYPSVNPKQVFVTGTPQFDFHFRREFHWSRAEFCAAVGCDPERPIVLYTTGMSNHMPGEVQIVEGIARLLRNMEDLGPPQLLVRVYPKDRSSRFDELRAKFPEVLFPDVPWEPAWLTPKLDDSYLLTNMLRHAEVGINVASTVSLELCMFDKPVINVGYNPPGIDPAVIDYGGYYRFDHYRPVVESRAVAVAGSERELGELLVESLLHPEHRSENRRNLIESFFGYTLDGWSSTRVAEVIQMLVSTNSGTVRGRVRPPFEHLGERRASSNPAGADS